MSYRRKEFDKLNDEFQETAASFFDNATLETLESVLDKYNAIIVYAEIDYENKKSATKEHITETVQANRVTLQDCFTNLNLPVILPGKLLSTIHYLPSVPKPEPPVSKPSASQLTQTDQIVSATQINQTDQIQQTSTITQTIEMAQTIADFMKYTQSILNYKYTGDPLELNGFISDAEMLQSLATSDETKQFCFKYVKNRVRGRAEEYIPENCASIEQMIEILKSKIKPENSTVVEGKILSLRLQKGDYSKFAQEAEKLSEAFRRALVVEGITKTKAEEMTINKMVDLCRKTTKVEIVKSVLESTKFDTPADVIAKFITQSDKARREYKEINATNSKSAFNSNNNNGNRKKNYDKNRNGNKNDNRSDNRYNNRGSNRNRNQQRNKGRNTDNRSNRSNEQTIRLIGGTPQPPIEQPIQPQEQFFRIEN